MASRPEDLVGRLGLTAKVRLLTGADFWSLPGDDSVGLRPVRMSDGPAGVRGARWDEREPSLNLPSGSALGATWDVALARVYGELVGAEARRKGVAVVLGPTINLHRSPYGGRHFEALSEDPLLTARLAAAYVEGVQAHGVAACPKHYVGNEYETERYTASSRIDDRTLREVYLAAFEDAVVEARAWAVMSAYNAVNGTTMSESPLLRDPLKTDWGFDGVVVSDWTAVRTTDAAARAAQDLVMPGPRGPWGDALVEAVRAGRVPETAVDEKVARLLRLASRVGALDGSSTFHPAVDDSHASRPAPGGAPGGSAVAEPTGAGGRPGPADGDPIAAVRKLAAEGMVLLVNRGELPWTTPPRSIAVLGPNALVPRTQGGGSATVLPERVVSPVGGLRARFPGAEFVHRNGVPSPHGVLPLPLDRLTDPVEGGRGVRVTIRDADGAVLRDEVRRATALVWLGDLPNGAATLELRTRLAPGGADPLAVACVGAVTVDVDGTRVIDAELAPEGGDIASALLDPPAATAPAPAETCEIKVVCTVRRTFIPGTFALTLGTAPHTADPDALLAEAVETARGAEAAVVVVGTSEAAESEGADRTTLALPGRQDDLVAAVAAANPRTVVVVNAGSPVLTPWRDDVAAVLVSWFGGQEMGDAVADVLAGDREPGGRLPTTWPADEASVPVASSVPENGELVYAEGVHVGHRGWLRAGAVPAYPFGHGLGYTTWDLRDAAAPASVPAGDPVPVALTVENTGKRSGKQVVQVYASRAASAVDRPVRWLVGFAAVRLDAGERRRVTVDVRPRGLAVWRDGWWTEPGIYEFHIGTSVADLPLRTAVEVTDPRA
ncbi:beta-glucosidase family protein [Actinomadura atramentaria]|uniref:beta-glucosidase family protein n=1 Tax=Actinomadura atramentaria TaxID=1990 RepID=UPI0003A3FAF4|nr:glycoside hydrolase family 3 C-terminal domain-containing protein [Actinomadura atramentaria]